MPRPLRVPSSDLFEGEDLALYEQLSATWMHGHPLVTPGATGWRAALLNWPAYAESRIELSRLLLTIPEREGSYSHADREWVDMVLCSHLHTNAVMAWHLPDGLGAGMRLDAVVALRAGRDEDLTPDERLLAVFIRQVVDGTVDDETYAAVEEYMGVRATVEYAIFITCLWTTIRQSQAFGSSGPSDEEVEQMIADFKSGAREVPTDWRERAIGPWPEPAATS